MSSTLGFAAVELPAPAAVGRVACLQIADWGAIDLLAALCAAEAVTRWCSVDAIGPCCTALHVHSCCSGLDCSCLLMSAALLQMLLLVGVLLL